MNKINNKRIVFYFMLLAIFALGLSTLPSSASAYHYYDYYYYNYYYNNYYENMGYNNARYPLNQPTYQTSPTTSMYYYPPVYAEPTTPTFYNNGPSQNIGYRPPSK